MLTEAQQQLAENNYKYAFWVANRWVKKQDVITRDELEGIALEALCEATVVYNPDRGCNFINFSKMRINQAIIKALQANQSTPKTISELSYAVAGKTCDCNREIEKLNLRCAIEELPQLQKDIVMDHYFNDLSRKEIALKYGISFNNVRHLLSVARDALKEKIA